MATARRAGLHSARALAGLRRTVTRNRPGRYPPDMARHIRPLRRASLRCGHAKAYHRSHRLPRECTRGDGGRRAVGRRSAASASTIRLFPCSPHFQGPRKRTLSALSALQPAQDTPVHGATRSDLVVALDGNRMNRFTIRSVEFATAQTLALQPVGLRLGQAEQSGGLSPAERRAAGTRHNSSSCATTPAGRCLEFGAARPARRAAAGVDCQARPPDS